MKKKKEVEEVRKDRLDYVVHVSVASRDLDLSIEKVLDVFEQTARGIMPGKRGRILLMDACKGHLIDMKIREISD